MNCHRFGEIMLGAALLLAAPLAAGGCSQGADPAARTDALTAPGGPGEPIGAAEQATSTCITLQEGSLGTVTDATIEQQYPSTNFGTGTGVNLAGTNPSGIHGQTLIQFDFSGGAVAPPNTAISSGVVALEQVGGATRGTINAYPILAPWTAGTVTWSSFGEAYGNQIVGDFTTTTAPDPVSFEISPLVIEWATGEAPNYGILLDGTPGHYDDVQSSRATTEGYHPQLTLCYTCLSGYSTCAGQSGCVSLDTDANCGSCGVACDPANGVGTCATGSCAVASCSAGFGDCDGNAANGCEANLETDPDNCGACGTVCVSGTCSSGMCSGTVCGARKVYSIVGETTPPLVNLTSDCSGTGDYPYNGCSGAYGFTWTDSLGGAPSSISVSFEQGIACDGDSSRTTTLNGVASTGFFESADECVCAPPAQAPTVLSLPVGPYVVDGSNTFLVTNSSSCEGLQLYQGTFATITVSNEVATDLSTDPNNCGSCGNVCTAPNGTPGCTGGSCTIVSCNSGFSPCNGACVNEETDPDNCGGCGIGCDGGQCSGGTCGGGGGGSHALFADGPGYDCPTGATSFEYHGHPRSGERDPGARGLRGLLRREQLRLLDLGLRGPRLRAAAGGRRLHLRTGVLRLHLRVHRERRPRLGHLRVEHDVRVLGPRLERASMAQKKPRGRTTRRAEARDHETWVRDVERAALLEPGGAAGRAIVIESPAQVEVHARSLRCPRCAGELRVEEHVAENGEAGRLRVARVVCATCGTRRALYFRLASTLLN
jgi:hypothetical protein